MLKLSNTTIVIIAAIVVIAAVVFLKNKTRIQEDWTMKQCVNYKNRAVNKAYKTRNMYQKGCSANLPPNIKKRNCDRRDTWDKVAEKRKSTHTKNCR